MLTSSYVPLNINWYFKLWFLADWVPYLSHLIRFFLSNRDILCVHERNFPYSLSCIYLMEVVW